MKQPDIVVRGTLKRGRPQRFLMLGTAVLALCGSGAAAARAAVANLTIEAEIVAAIDLNCAVPLNFGGIAASSNGSANVLTVDPGNSFSAISGGGDGQYLGGASAGQCSISAAAGRDVAVDTTAATVSVHHATSAATMTVSDFLFTTPDEMNDPGPTVMTTTGSPQDIDVGATLTINSGQAPGQYSGTVAITAHYN